MARSRSQPMGGRHRTYDQSVIPPDVPNPEGTIVLGRQPGEGDEKAEKAPAKK